MSRAERTRAEDDSFWNREVVTELSSGIRQVGGLQDVVEWVKEDGGALEDRREIVADWYYLHPPNSLLSRK